MTSSSAQVVLDLDLLEQRRREIVGAAVKKALAGQQDDHLLTVDEAAASLSISPTALRKRVGRSQIPCHRVDRLLRFRRDQLVRQANGPTLSTDGSRLDNTCSRPSAARRRREVIAL
jgi:excisionase family DNA binding protein